MQPQFQALGKKVRHLIFMGVLLTGLLFPFCVFGVILSVSWRRAALFAVTGVGMVWTLYRGTIRSVEPAIRLAETEAAQESTGESVPQDALRGYFEDFRKNVNRLSGRIFAAMAAMIFGIGWALDFALFAPGYRVGLSACIVDLVLVTTAYLILPHVLKKSLLRLQDACLGR